MLRFLAWRQLDKCINMSLRVTADIQKVSFGCQAEPGLSATVRTIVAIIGVERVAGEAAISGDHYIPKTDVKAKNKLKKRAGVIRHASQEIGASRICNLVICNNFPILSLAGFTLRCLFLLFRCILDGTLAHSGDQNIA